MGQMCIRDRPSDKVVPELAIRMGKSSTKAAPTSTGEGNMNFGTRPRSDTACHKMRSRQSKIAADSLLVMLRNFLVNGKHLAIWLIADFYIGHQRGTARCV